MVMVMKICMSAAGAMSFPPNSTALIDRLYLNDGKGGFTKSPQVLPFFYI
jgi:hypothetical protein